MSRIGTSVGYMSEYFHYAAIHDLERASASQGGQTPGQTPGQSPRNIYILRCISLGFGMLSTVSITISFYWFVRMRRSFRHEYVSTSTFLM